MTMHPESKRLLSELTELSRGRITLPMELGFLLDLSRTAVKSDILEKISFHAKFIVKTFDLMKKVGKGGDGYEKLSEEFSGNIEKCRALIGELLVSAEAAERSQFTERFLVLTPHAMENLMKLFHDLSWYKNYLIDKT